MSTGDIEIIDKYLNDNEYDTDSIIQDLEDNEQSNIETYLLLKNKIQHFMILKEIITDYTAPVQQKQHTLCTQGTSEVFDDKCLFIAQIIEALKIYNKDNEFKIDMKKINVMQILAAYDHMIDVHKFCKGSMQKQTDDEQQDEKEINYKHKVQKYIVEEIGYCKLNNCQILKQHIMRRRETISKYDDNKAEQKKDDGIAEIIKATLNALHSYILHETTDLYRLKREDNNLHFVTAVIDVADDIIENKETTDNKEETDNKDKTENKEATDKTVSRIQFGQNVLEWFEYGEEPPYQSFREAIINNPESTIDAKLYLSFATECFIKINSHKNKHYLLDELLSVKLYTDTNEYQSNLRRAHWAGTSKKTRKWYYVWALQLYKTHLFHAKQIPRWTMTSKGPTKLYHGLNRVFILTNASAKYNGPISTTITLSVAHSFSAGKGLLWTVKSSYANPWKFVCGISVSWISQHKNEDEMLLVNQIMPVSEAINFVKNIEKKVNQLVFTLKEYKKRIEDPNRFYNMLGFKVTEEMIDIIKRHPILYQKHDIDGMGKRISVLSRVLNELKINDAVLIHRYNVLTSTIQCEYSSTFNYLSFKVNKKKEYMDNHYENCEYKIMIQEKGDLITEHCLYFKYGDTAICTRNGYLKYIFQCTSKIFIKNNELFGIDDYIFVSVAENVINVTNSFYSNLLLLNDECVVSIANTSCVETKYHSDALNCEYMLVWNEDTPRIVIEHGYIYSFDNIKNIYLLVPYNNTKQQKFLSLYVRPKKHQYFILFKQFETKQQCKHHIFDTVAYLLKIFTNATHLKHSKSAKHRCDQLNMKWNTELISHIYRFLFHEPLKANRLNEWFIKSNIVELAVISTVYNQYISGKYIIHHPSFNYHSFRGKVPNMEKIPLTYFKSTQFKFVNNINEGSLFCFGSGDNGLLGLSNYVNKLCLLPTVCAGFDTDNMTQVATFYNHCLGIDMFGNTYAWGDCSYKIDFLAQKRLMKKRISEHILSPQILRPFSTKNKAIKVAVGVEHSLILTRERKVWSFGSNRWGQLGYGDLKDNINPRMIEQINDCEIVHISCGEYHNCAISNKGQLFVWGRNDYAQCGLGQFSNEKIMVPTILNLNKYDDEPLLIPVYSDCGCSHTVILTRDGVILSCGYNKMGQLGHGDEETHYIPKIVNSLLGKRVINISCGGLHTICVTEDGKVYSWGNGEDGRLGHGKTWRKRRPTMIKFFDEHNTKIVACAAGINHSCVISSQGEVYMFGCGEFGQLGDNTTDSALTPKKIKAFDTVSVSNIILGDCCTFIIGRRLQNEANNVDIILKYGEEINVQSAILRSYSIFIQNQQLFGDNDWILMQQNICNHTFTDLKNGLVDNLNLTQSKQISLDSSAIDGEYYEEIKTSTYLISCNDDKKEMMEMKAEDVINVKCDGYRLYYFDAINDVLFDIPWIQSTEKKIMKMYVKPSNGDKFVFLTDLTLPVQLLLKFHIDFAQMPSYFMQITAVDTEYIEIELTANEIQNNKRAFFIKENEDNVKEAIVHKIIIKKGERTGCVAVPIDNNHDELYRFCLYQSKQAKDFVSNSTKLEFRILKDKDQIPPQNVNYKPNSVDTSTVFKVVDVENNKLNVYWALPSKSFGDISYRIINNETGKMEIIDLLPYYVSFESIPTLFKVITVTNINGNIYESDQSNSITIALLNVNINVIKSKLSLNDINDQKYSDFEENKLERQTPHPKPTDIDPVLFVQPLENKSQEYNNTNKIIKAKLTLKQMCLSLCLEEFKISKNENDGGLIMFL
eukprot:140708_1